MFEVVLFILCSIVVVGFIWMIRKELKEIKSTKKEK